MNKLPSYIEYNEEYEESLLIHSCVFFDVIRWYNFPETLDVLNRICDEIPEDFKHKRQYLNIILMNCINSGCSNTGFSVGRSTRIWAEFNRNHKSLLAGKVSVRHLIKCLDYMEDLGYLYCIKGRKEGINNDYSHYSCYFASDELLKELGEHYQAITESDIRPPVVLRDENKEDITPDVLPDEIQKRAELVKNYNRYISRKVVKVERPIYRRTCTGSDEHGDPLFRMRQYSELHRFGVKLQVIYNEDFKHGGRFYALNVIGGVQHQETSNSASCLDSRKLDRRTITINNEPTIELDYASLHVNMAYAECGKQLTKDAYGWLSADKRWFAKIVTLISLNCTSREQAIGAIQKHVETHRHMSVSRDEVEDALALMEAYHQPLAQKMYHGCYGMHLQNVDSNIMEVIIRECLKRNIAVLPIHDSVVVSEDNADHVVKIMRDAYSEVMGGFTIDVCQK